jgi:hypothetical protein
VDCTKVACHDNVLLTNDILHRVLDLLGPSRSAASAGTPERRGGERGVTGHPPALKQVTHLISQAKSIYTVSQPSCKRITAVGASISGQRLQSQRAGHLATDVATLRGVRRCRSGGWLEGHWKSYGTWENRWSGPLVSRPLTSKKYVIR